MSRKNIVIAASDSLNKDTADYICDGIDDQVEIQAAIDTFPELGIQLSKGSYNTNGTINIPNKIEGK